MQHMAVGAKLACGLVLLGLGWWAAHSAAIRRASAGEGVAPPATTTAPSDLRAEPRLGGGEPGELALKIENLREGQKPIEKAPWFEAGGDWAVFDCVTGQGADHGRMTIGFKIEKKGNDVFSFGKTRIVATDRAAGERLLRALCKGFGAAMPRERTATPLVPRDMSTAILGEHMPRDPEGGFSGQAGGWTATKLFMGEGDDEVEVFFNFNLKSGQAEFSEKDADYRKGLAEAMAETLRDGPRPIRTPATDPTMTDSGPKITDLETLEMRPGTRWQFSDGHLLLFEPQGKGTALVSANPAKATEREIWATVDGDIDEVNEVGAAGQVLIVGERIPKKAGEYSSDDVGRIWRIEGPQGRKVEIKGEWSNRGSLSEPGAVSPDGGILAVHDYQKVKGQDKQMQSLIFLADAKTGKTLSTILLPAGGYGQVRRWQGQGQQTRAIVEVDSDAGERQTVQLVEVDPWTGQRKALIDTGVLSPSGLRSMTLIERQRVTVKDLRTGETREFRFHEDDQRYAREGSVMWVSDDYLALNTRGLAFINVKTMKMSMLGKDRELKTAFQFSPDFKWAAAEQDGKLLLGSVVVP